MNCLRPRTLTILAAWSVVGLAVQIPSLAWAAVDRHISAEARVDGFRIDLVDLDPDDGIDPWIRIDHDRGSTRWGVRPIDRVAGSFRGVATGIRSLDLTGSLAGGDLSLSWAASAGWHQRHGAWVSMDTGRPGFRTGWLVSPGTEVVLTFDQHVRVTDFAEPPGGPGGVMARLVTEAGFGVELDRVHPAQRLRSLVDAPDAQDRQTMTLRYRNPGDHDAETSLVLSSYYVVKAMPEPSTWLMGLVGVVAVLTRVRRRG